MEGDALISFGTFEISELLGEGVSDAGEGDPEGVSEGVGVGLAEGLHAVYASKQ